MSTLTVSTLIINNLQSTNATSNQAIFTGNTQAGSITVRSDGGLILSSNSSTNGIVVTSGANVGIGNNSPNAKLQVTGTANVSGNVIFGGTLASGNATITGFANISSTLACGNVTITGIANVSSNTFNLGSSSLTSNGYTYLPNGLIFQWGEVTANSSSAGDITFPIPFTTSLYSITTTCLATVNSSTYNINLLAANTTTANVRSGNATSRSVYWQAIGI